jgi:hypothetical protein
VAAVVMLVALRQGLPPNSDETRLAFIRAHPIAWTAGWICWSLAAVTLVAIVIVLARRARTIIPIVLVLAGAAFDITSEARYVLEMPDTAGPAFRALDRNLEIAIGGIANGLYTLAIALLVLKMPQLPRRVKLISIPVVLAGFFLAIASFVHHPIGEIVSSAVLFPAFILWSWDVGRWLQRGV